MYESWPIFEPSAEYPACHTATVVEVLDGSLLADGSQARMRAILTWVSGWRGSIVSGGASLSRYSMSHRYPYGTPPLVPS